MGTDNERVPLGKSGISVSALGAGTWQWGDRMVWQYGRSGNTDADIESAFRASLEAGIDFFDTAEAYGQGRSETLLGGLVRSAGRPVVVASKFMPYPWRLRRGSFRRALSRTLARLGMERVDLYQIHFPSPPLPVETWVDALGEAAQAGLTRAAGVSNFTTAQVIRAHAALATRGLPLATVQVRYNVLSRDPERNGLLETCARLGITLIAYSPLAQGMLTGKYSVEHPPAGLRRLLYAKVLARLAPLSGLLSEIGQAHGTTPAQVALNWTICKGALPIPGARNLRQARENAGALGWRLSAAEVSALDESGDRVRQG